jgi:tripartite-type tricarboxylate transporter receptor subunit TctC
MPTSSLRRLLIAALIGLVPTLAFTQTFPSGPVTIVVPYAAGGLTDGLARALSARLAERWKQPVIVENRAGAGTVIGNAVVARAPADGHTLLMTSFGFVTSQFLVPDLPYKPQSLAPLAMLADAPSVLFVHPSVPANNIPELVRYMKSQKTPMTFASSGNGSSPHIAAELFASMAGVEITHVPYRGNGPAITDLLGGQVQALFDSVATLAHVKTGKLKTLGVASAQQAPQAPELTPIAQSGVADLAGFTSGSWFGILLPAATPTEIQARLAADIRAVLETPAMRDAILKGGVQPVLSSQAEFTDYLRSETTKWGRIIKEKNIRAQ